MAQLQVTFRSQELEVTIPVTENLVARVNHYNQLHAIAHDNSKSSIEKTAAVQEMNEMYPNLALAIGELVLKQNGPAYTLTFDLRVTSAKVINTPSRTPLSPATT